MLNLKGKLMIDDENYDIEIKGDISSFKFDGKLFVRQDKTQDEAVGGQIDKVKETTDKTTLKPKEKSRSYKKRKIFPWHSAEDKILEENYSIKTVSEIIKDHLPSRSPGSIYERANALGLRKNVQYKKKKPKVKKSAFTSSEITEHKLLKPDEKPNITIKEDDEWSFEEEEFLRENFFKFGIETIIKDNLLTSKTEEQIRAKVKYMGMTLK